MRRRETPLLLEISLLAGYESPYGNTNILACIFRKDSDQSGNLPCLSTTLRS